MSWSEYVRRLMKDQTQEQAAEKIGTSGPTVSRWLAGQQPSAKVAIEVARAYGDSPLNALVAVGFISEIEARQRPTAPGVDWSQVSNDELLRIVRDRMEPEAGRVAKAARSPRKPRP